MTPCGSSPSRGLRSHIISGSMPMRKCSPSSSSNSRDDALEVLARVRVEQLAGLRVVAVAVHARDARVPGQHGERVEVGDRRELGLLGAEPDVVAEAVGEEVGGRPVDELVALLGDLGEERRHDALAHDAPGDGDLLEEDVLDALGLDLARERLDLRGTAGLVPGFLERRRGHARTSALQHRGDTAPERVRGSGDLGGTAVAARVWHRRLPRLGRGSAAPYQRLEQMGTREWGPRWHDGH